ncbi:hypothetical protein C7Y47_02025 [Lysinibacillus sphaericus]|uniref:Pre-toxin TG domain-containing protein n=1 Tax=Lysinibacillus sphaericus TaxID=1421 RepID=A0A544V144_LYSSH|nr:pre-toxin TG domain-containing protein [Lysinibacillus sp. SDF0037]TQR39824.1 hypothetical protein C7Y47_02025 [Lysinibacillus sp. SDF0037]
MAKKGKSKSIGFFGAIGSLLGCIPAVRNVKKAIGKALKKKIKKAKNKLKLKKLFKRLKKNFKKKRGKVFTKARKLKNKLSKRKLSKMFKKAVKKAVLAQKKADKRATTKGGKASKAAVKQVKKYEKAQNLKLISMGLNCVPIFGNIKALYEMGTGKDLITGQTKQTGKKIIDEAELEKYLKDRQYVSNGNRNSVNAGEPITTLEDLQAVVGGGHYTLPQSKPTIVERFILTLLFEDIVTLVDPKSTTGERILAGLSMLPTSKPFKIVDAGYDTYKYSKKTTKIIEDSKKTYTSNNKKNDVPNNNNIPNSNSKKEDKAPIVEVTEKDVKELGEYIKNIDKGTVNAISVNRDTIINSATQAKKGGETVVGHALQKHGGRHPDIWGKVKGGSDQINQTAKKHLEEIINAPGDFIKVTNDRGITFIEKRLPDGRGVRLNQDGTFKGFID